jgi:hypothetical protein
MNEQEPLTTSDLAAGRTSSEPTAAEPADQASAPPAGGESGDTQAERGMSALFDQSDRDGLQERWKAIQTGFVDQPRHSVEQADALVAEAMSMLAETFAQERQALERQWGEGADVSTEDLRVALQRYRSFFERLLAA